MATTQRILRLPDVKALTGLSRSTIYDRASKGLFPRPLSLGGRSVGWWETEIAAVNAARIRGEHDDVIRALVVELEVARKNVA